MAEVNNPLERKVGYASTWFPTRAQLSEVTSLRSPFYGQVD